MGEIIGPSLGGAGPAPAPYPPDLLRKFDDSDRIGRTFDNGWIVVFNVSALHGGC